MNHLKPAGLPPQFESVPDTLQALDQWCVWHYAINDKRDKWTKPPIDAKGALQNQAKHASSTDSKTWCDFDTAKRAYVMHPPTDEGLAIPDDPKDDPKQSGLNGIGFFPTTSDNLTGIDLDHCLDAEGKPLPWAVPILEHFSGTYTEVSPSGTGLRIFCNGQKPSSNRSKRGDIEMYDGRTAKGKQGGRYLTLTGHSFGNPQPITDKQEAVKWLYETYLEPQQEKPQAKTTKGDAASPSLDDTALLEKMFSSGKGGEIKALWDGDTSGYAQDTNEGHSEADLALCSHLAWWCNYDTARADSLFRKSGLMRPKWDEGRGADTYGQLTLARACEGRAPGEGYTGEKLTANRQQASEPEKPWPELELLPGLYPPVPSLPAELIPEPLRAFVQDVGERTSLPLELIAAPLLVSLGAVNGRNVGIYPKRKDDWLVTPNLWGGIIGKPGVMKTAAISEATKPLSALAAKAHERYETEAAEAEVTRAQLELEISALKEQAKRDAKKGGVTSSFRNDLQDLQAELRDATVIERRYITQDSTVEKTGELLKENPRGILVLRDELAGWLRTLDRPGREGEREFYLEAWNGTGHFTFDRIGRGTVHIPALTLSILGAIQPGKLEHYLNEALAGGGGADGLLQRFQLIVYPDSVGAYHHVDRFPDSAARKRVNILFEKLDTLEPADLGLDSQESEIPALRFSEEAQDLFDTWRTELETRLRSGELDHKPAFSSHIAKYRSLMPSLALIFHLLEIVEGSTRANSAVSVSLEAAQLAAAWCEYLEAHALKLYAQEVSSHIKAAQLIERHIEDGEIEDNKMTVRELYRKGCEGLDDRETVMEGLEVLAEHHLIRLQEKVTGGRPTQVIRLHPNLRQG